MSKASMAQARAMRAKAALLGMSTDDFNALTAKIRREDKCSWLAAAAGALNTAKFLAMGGDAALP